MSEASRAFDVLLTVSRADRATLGAQIRVGRAYSRLPPEQIVLAPDCGMKDLPRGPLRLRAANLPLRALCQPARGGPSCRACTRP